MFHQLDVDRDGVLNQEEMRHFAVETGFKGSDHQWAETYDALCGSWRNPHDGVDLDLFFRFVDDFSEEASLGRDRGHGLSRCTRLLSGFVEVQNCHAEASRRVVGIVSK